MRYERYAERFEDGEEDSSEESPSSDAESPWVQEGSAHWAARTGDMERMRFLVEVERVDLAAYDRYVHLPYTCVGGSCTQLATQATAKLR